MKLVRENINFERGKEVKDTLGLGLSQFIAKGLEEMGQFSAGNDPNPLLVYKANKTQDQYDYTPEKYYIEISGHDFSSRKNIDKLIEKHLNLKFFSDISEESRMYHRWILWIKEDYAEVFLKANAINLKKTRIQESLDFERSTPYKSLRIGKYKPQHITIKDYEGDVHNIEVIDNSFKLYDLNVELKFHEDPDVGETADVYVDGEKSDMSVFKMTPADYEFKNQGEYADPGYTGYGLPIAKDKEHLEQLKDENSYWHVSSGDYSRGNKNPFVAVAEMVIYIY